MCSPGHHAEVKKMLFADTKYHMSSPVCCNLALRADPFS
jgi:hypothetical protein